MAKGSSLVLGGGSRLDRTSVLFVLLLVVRALRLGLVLVLVLVLHPLVFGQRIGELCREKEEGEGGRRVGVTGGRSPPYNETLSSPSPRC